MEMEQTECSETSTLKIQTPGNYPEGSIQYSKQGEILKSRKIHTFQINVTIQFLVSSACFEHQVFIITLFCNMCVCVGFVMCGCFRNMYTVL